jgi:hypothetical protein
LAVHGNRHLAGIALGQPKIHNVRLTIFVNHDVRRLHIAMDDPPLMCVMQSVGNGCDQLRCFLLVRSAAREQIGERHSLHELADQVGNIVDLAHLVNRNDCRMSKLGHAACFA